MKKYISTAVWRDLESGHVYSAGEAFPFKGDVSEDRIASLASSQNKAGFAVIKAVEEKVEAEEPQAEETPKKATRSRKKT